MKSKKIVTIILGAFVVLSVGVLIYKESSTALSQSQLNINPKTEETKEQAQEKTRKWVEAYYFHTTARCYTCTKMEEYIRKALNEEFVNQLKNNDLKFQTINVDRQENQHFINDYKLHTKSFILSLNKNGKEERWLNCDKIWHLVKSEEMFKKYIKSEVKKYLEM